MVPHDVELEDLKLLDDQGEKNEGYDELNCDPDEAHGLDENCLQLGGLENGGHDVRNGDPDVDDLKDLGERDGNYDFEVGGLNEKHDSLVHHDELDGEAYVEDHDVGHGEDHGEDHGENHGEVQDEGHGED